MLSDNMFINYIYESRRCKFKFFHWIKFLFFIHKLNRVVPNYDLMIQICDFIKALELTYLYPNNLSCELFTVKAKKDENSFCVKVNNTNRIVVTLYKIGDDKYIRIDIMASDSNKPRSSISFKEGEAEVSNIHDEQLFINVNDWIMNSLVRLLVQYYKR